MEGNGTAHILQESNFWFRQISAPEIFLRRKKNGFSTKIGCSGILSSKILTEGHDEQGSKYWFSLRFNVALQYSGALIGKNEKQIVAGPLMVLCQILASKIWDLAVLYGFIYWVLDVPNR